MDPFAPRAQKRPRPEDVAASPSAQTADSPGQPPVSEDEIRLGPEAAAVRWESDEMRAWVSKAATRITRAVQSADPGAAAFASSLGEATTPPLHMLLPNWGVWDSDPAPRLASTSLLPCTKQESESGAHPVIGYHRGREAPDGPTLRWWAPAVNASALLDPGSPELGRVFGLVGEFEAPFVRGVGVSSGLGVTRDGAVLNYTTGTAAQLHDFSAASKEGFHLALAARCIADAAEALGGRPRASAASDPGLQLARKELLRALCGWPSSGSRRRTAQAAGYWVATLGAKLDSFARFNSSFPGFGGYLPWFSVPANNSGSMGLLQGWENRVPALDNGELFWGVVAAGQAARRLAGAASEAPGFESAATEAESLAARLEAVWSAMAATARTLFWGGAESRGAVFAVTTIANVSLPPGQSPVSGSGRLDDPYEGELFTWVLDLLTGLDAAEREDLWLAKRPQLAAVPYRMPSQLAAQGAAAPDTVSVQRGFWFSAHEQMKGLYLPYTDASLVPTSAKVLRACEVARAADSAARRVPGLFASVTDVAAVPPSDLLPPVIPGYISAAGIAALASQPIQRRDVVTPYGAMAMALVAPREAAVWYVHTLAATAMQGPLGSTAACNVNGTEIAPVATWDSKSSTVLGFLGGVGDLTGEALAALPDTGGATKLDRFRAVTEREMQRVFGTTVPGSDLPIALPTAAVPRTEGLRDFVTC
ncbi:hypothetical protein FNF31_06949 [Cafeteria roenbergensis]|uniref:Endo-beta-1,2-glucanase SGL domain-containing protein n=1 Tax=Cafeteria roenbergensis TaxID=33653 RepID=A0A5A8CFZ6_CAFRO|nr:hypothetical protein FNF31_06949 [Cafeteria roenbergensis]